VRRDGDLVTVAVDDDGAGGARIGAGTGLRGLQDRLAALDGTLSIESPRGEGTRLRARIPCGADALVAEARADATAAPPAAAAADQADQPTGALPPRPSTSRA
jgi:signal transduction histidine kinase